MRRCNGILARIIIALFMLHALMGSLMLLGISTISFEPLSWTLLAAVVAHGVLGAVASVRTFKSGNGSGKWYFKENFSFWAKRITGLTILILLAFHVSAYTTYIDGVCFLKKFTLLRMVAQVLLITSIFIHLLVSIKPMLIARGTLKFKERAGDIVMLVSIMMMLFTVAVVIYYIQWQI